MAESIRQDILRNELAPGQRLVEADLCARFGANRRTIRAALADLTHSGLVERIANRGARVRVVSFQEALETAEVRQEVEALCVARAAERITPPDIDALQTLTTALETSVADNDPERFAAITDQIFRTYVRLAAHPVAEEVLNRLRAQSARHGFRLRYRPGWLSHALPQWIAVVEAICARDPEAARQALRRHSEAWQAATKALAEDGST
ncbi:GntR family transcriptional regulator, partial [Devosia sp.]|uniref:GntR family transcriptional regulator n=1 Tax=Devosia sp. TaxID=1871048 RepID=UPI002AFDEC3F